MPTITPYPAINAVLYRLLADVQAVLGDAFVGLYLYGSLAGGDFDPHTSDIDFLVVTAEEIPGELIPALEAMHMRLATSGQKWAAKLEGSYISRRALRRYRPDDPPRPTVNEGHFYLAPHDSDWIIQRHIIREQGVVLAGPAPQTLIDPVSPDDIREAVRGVLHGWWAPMLHSPARLETDVYRAYATLSMCRALHALQHGTIVSKPVAARWAQETLGEPWAGLIGQALAWRPDAPAGDTLPLDETLAFIRYVLSSSGLAGDA